MAKTYDSKCYELACIFLSDVKGPLVTDRDRDALAGDIQDTIETFLHDLETREKFT